MSPWEPVRTLPSLCVIICDGFGYSIYNTAIRFMKNQVLGYVTNLIFPAIFGTHNKTGEEIDKLIMSNFEANKMDNSISGAIKGIGKGLGVKESSVKES